MSLSLGPGGIDTNQSNVDFSPWPITPGDGSVARPGGLGFILDYNQEYNPPNLYGPDSYRASDHDPVIVHVKTGTEDPPVAGDARTLPRCHYRGAAIHRHGGACQANKPAPRAPGRDGLADSQRNRRRVDEFQYGNWP